MENTFKNILDDKNKQYNESKDKKLKLKNSFNSQLISKKIFPKHDIIQLKVILTISYHKESYEFWVPALKIKNKLYDEFNLYSIIENIFSKFDNKFYSKYILSYRFDDDDDKSNEKKFIYFGEIKLGKEKEHFLQMPKNYTLYLNLRQKIDVMNPLECSFENLYFEYDNTFQLEEKEKEEKINKKIGGRQNERVIGKGIQLVFLYKKILELSKGEISCVDAAKTIKIPKKTLDEYESQIKEGKDNNFDFFKHYKDKMNVLRDYNLKCKKE